MRSVEDIRVEPERLPGGAQAHSFYEEMPTQQVSLEGASNLEPAFDECRPSHNCYTTDQLTILEHMYSKNEIVDIPTSVFLSHCQGIKRKNVRLWFQNKRQRRINKLRGINKEPTDILTYGKTDPYNLHAMCLSIVTQENYDQRRYQSNGPTIIDYENVANPLILTQENYDRERCQSNGPTTTDYETFRSTSYHNTNIDTSRSPSSCENIAILKQENYDRQRYSNNVPILTNYEAPLSIPYQYYDLDTGEISSNLKIETGQPTYTSKEGHVSNKSTPTYDNICEVYEEMDCIDFNMRVPQNTEFFGAIKTDDSSNSIQGNDDIEGHGKQIQHQRPVIRLIERNSHADNLNSQLRKARERKRNVDRLIEEVLKLDTYLAQEQESPLSDNESSPIRD